MSACTCPCPQCGDLTAALSAAQDEIERSIADRETLRDQRDRLVAIVDSQPHLLVDSDNWYSCSQAIDPWNGELACIDDDRRGKPCDCGQAALVAKAHAIIGGAS